MRFQGEEGRQQRTCRDKGECTATWADTLQAERALRSEQPLATASDPRRRVPRTVGGVRSEITGHDCAESRVCRQ